jgi:hypothetical protein
MRIFTCDSQGNIEVVDLTEIITMTEDIGESVEQLIMDIEERLRVMEAPDNIFTYGLFDVCMN